MARATAFIGLESSEKLRRGRPLGPILLGFSVWQELHWVPSEATHCSMMLWTCCPVRFLGSTFRFVGAGKVLFSGAGAVYCEACGDCAEPAKMKATASNGTASAVSPVPIAVCMRRFTSASFLPAPAR